MVFLRFSMILVSFGDLGGSRRAILPLLEAPGSCLGMVLGAILENVASKMVLSWLSLAIIGQLGAKIC